MTMPVRIRPRMLTPPVNGHFLSIYVPSIAYEDRGEDVNDREGASFTSRGVLKPKPTLRV